MPYDARVFNVLIASPSDVGPERAIVRDVIYEWNSVNAIARKIVLMPVGWETHTSPDIGESAQAIINHQIVEQCDMLVAVFWTRLGTPTRDHPSGTVEEVEKLIAAKRPVMIYFSGTPVELDSVDHEEYGRLKKFRESCKTRGLFESYAGLAQFREKLYRHLQLKLNSDPLFNISVDQDTTEVVKSAVSAPQLSREAEVLLKRAAASDDGAIYFMRYLGGTELQVGAVSLINNQDRREVAKWESALQELLRYGYAVARGTKGEFYELTNAGFQAAELLSP